MTPQFKVGDVVIGQNFVHRTQFNGVEGEIVEVLFDVTAHYKSGKTEILNVCYQVLWANGFDDRKPDGKYPNTVTPERHLRLKRPHEELSSWDKIEEICGWKPGSMMITARVHIPTWFKL